MHRTLPLFTRATVQISLFCLFWFYFGRLSLDRFLAHRVMATTSTLPTATSGLRPPAVTVCARLAATEHSWRGEAGGWRGLSYYCEDATNVTRCIEEKTFSLDEVVHVENKGRNRTLMDPSHWTEDFSRPRNGRCNTLNYGGNVTENKHDILLFFAKDDTKELDMYVHDPHFFLINLNPMALSKSRHKSEINKKTYNQISVVEHQLLNVPTDQCEAAPNYSFMACVKESFSSRVGCRLPWDRWSNPARPVCTTFDQFRQFEDFYDALIDKSTSWIEALTKCLKPCRYKEYRHEAGPIRFSTTQSKDYNSSIGLWYVSMEAVLSVQTKAPRGVRTVSALIGLYSCSDYFGYLSPQ
jgi:hypothetical protein